MTPEAPIEKVLRSLPVESRAGDHCVVQEIQQYLRVQSFSGPEWIEGTKRFELLDGTEVASIGSGECVICSSGERLSQAAIDLAHSASQRSDDEIA